MKSISDFIITESLWENYGIVLCTLNINPKDDENKLTKEINELIDNAFTQYQVLRVSAVEKYNSNGVYKDKKDRQKAEDDAVKDALKELQTKENILTKSEKYQQSWIRRKVETNMRHYDKFYSGFKPIDNKMLSRKDVKLTYDFHHDVWGQECGMFPKGWDDKLVKEVIDYIKRKKGVEQIIITCDDFLDRNGNVHFHVFPKFSDKIEAKNEKERKSFYDYMHSQYNLGKYMGD